MNLKISVAAGLLAGLLAFAASSDTRLADAVQNGDRAAIRALLAKKVDVNAPQGDGTTALHWAAINNRIDVVKYVLPTHVLIPPLTTPFLHFFPNGFIPKWADPGLRPLMTSSCHLLIGGSHSLDS